MSRHKKQYDNLDNCLILVDKPINYSSFYVVKKLKNHFGFRKIGHNGTLDPFASGLLVIGTNKLTKAINNEEYDQKTYLVVIKFNSSTTTFDVKGEITNTTDKKVKYTPLNQLINKDVDIDIDQTPPIYSALKVKGKRLYEYALDKQEVEIKPRKVHIYHNELIEFDYENQTAILKLKVSKGFYVRSYVNDLGIRLDNYAYCTALRRIAVGKYNISNAYTLNELLEKQTI